jgi:hypothetical protein
VNAVLNSASNKCSPTDTTGVPDLQLVKWYPKRDDREWNLGPDLERDHASMHRQSPPQRREPTSPSTVNPSTGNKCTIQRRQEWF